MTAPATHADRQWLFGPVPDLLLGCGGLYLALFAIQVAAGEGMRLAAPLAWLPFLSLALGAPHYGATLLQACAPDKEGRTRAFFALWVGALLLAAFAAGLEYLALGSLLVTLYVTWSPWHYSGQNYGILLILLRQRDVDFDAVTKRLLRVAFIASYALTFIALHSASPSGAYAPLSYKGTAYDVLPLGIPGGLRDVLYFAAAAAFAVGSGIAWVRLARVASLRTLAPALLLWAMQTLWFVAPPLARLLPWELGVDPLAPENAAYSLMWIAVGHFVQYLWITSYFARRSGMASNLPGYFARSLAAGGALWVMPGLLFAPALLGSLPFDMGLGVLAASVVNLHHFIVDGVIWKTQMGPIARRVRAEATPAALGRPEVGRWVGRATWIAGTACVLVALVGFWEAEFGLRRAGLAGDMERVDLALKRLEWIGRESPKKRLAVARHALKTGERARARREIDASLAIYETADAQRLLGSWHQGAGQWPAAVTAYERAVALEPDHVTGLYRAGVALLRVGEPDRALARLTAAASLDPDDVLVRKSLDRARSLASSAPR